MNRTGVYRGVVVDADDPKERGRVRVFVYGINRLPPDPSKLVRHQQTYYDIVNRDLFAQGADACIEGGEGLDTGGGGLGDLPDDGVVTSSGGGTVSIGEQRDWLSLPWSERADHSGGHLYGNIAPTLLPGSLVWVMYEQGDEALPVVMGSAIANAGTDPDGGARGLPGDRVGDYAWNKFRHLNVDVMGSGLVSSADPRDGYARVVSGAAYVEVSAAKQSVNVSAPEGRFHVDTMSINLWAEQQAFLCGSEVSIQSYGKPFPRGDGEFLAEHMSKDDSKISELSKDRDDAQNSYDAAVAGGNEQRIANAQANLDAANAAIDNYNIRAGGNEDSSTASSLGTRTGVFSTDTVIVHGAVETFIGQYGKYTGTVAQSERVYVTPKYAQIGCAMPMNRREVYGGTLHETFAVHVEASRKAIIYVRDSDSMYGSSDVDARTYAGVIDVARACYTGPWAGMLSAGNLAIASDRAMILGQAVHVIPDYCEGGLSEYDRQPTIADAESNSAHYGHVYQSENCGIWPRNLMLGRHNPYTNQQYIDDTKLPTEGGPGLQRSQLTHWGAARGGYQGDEHSELLPTERLEGWATKYFAFVTEGASVKVCTGGGDEEEESTPEPGSEEEAISKCSTCNDVVHVKNLGDGQGLIHAAGTLTLASNTSVVICAPSVEICNTSNFPTVACGTPDDFTDCAWIAAKVMNGHPCPTTDDEGNQFDPRTGQQLTENDDGTVVGEDGKPFCVTYLQHVGPCEATVSVLTHLVDCEDYEGNGSTASGNETEGAQGGVAIFVSDSPIMFDYRGHRTTDDGLDPPSDGESENEPDPTEEDPYDGEDPPSPCVLVPQFLVDLGDIPAPQAGKFLQATGPNTFVWADAGGGSGASVFGDNGHQTINKPGTRRGGAGAWIEARDNAGAIEIHHVGPVSTVTSTVTIQSNGTNVGSITFDPHGHYNGPADNTINVTLTLPAHALTDHTDVTIAAPADGHGLWYNGGTNQWENFDRDADDGRDIVVQGGDEIVNFTIESSAIRITYRPVSLTVTRNKLNGAVNVTRSVGANETIDLTRTDCP